jgi:heptosyltransferase-2
MRKILVLRGGALGDFIVTLPALTLLRERWPRARLELVGNATAAQLARNRGLLDAVHSQHEARWSALFGDAPLPPELARWLGEFDLVVSYWPDPDGELRRRFPLHAEQTFLAAAAMPTHAPAAAHYCEPLKALGLETREYFVRLEAERVILNPPHQELPERAERCVKDNTSCPIAIHPGSGSPRKNWPVEKWRELIARLPAPVHVILGAAEIVTCGPAFFPGTSGIKPDRHPSSAFLVNRPLEELVAHFSRCRLFLGHDSGISHLAAACGVPCVLLFGPTEPAVWAPPAPNVRILRSAPGELAALPVADVERAVTAALSDRT